MFIFQKTFFQLYFIAFKESWQTLFDLKLKNTFEKMFALSKMPTYTTLSNWKAIPK